MLEVTDVIVWHGHFGTSEMLYLPVIASVYCTDSVAYNKSSTVFPSNVPSYGISVTLTFTVVS